MRFRKLPQFDRDFKALPRESQAMFKETIREVFNPACDDWVNDPNAFVWPTTLRFERVRSAKNVCAITWSFKRPDGRATFEFEQVDNIWYCVWRRIGDHSVYDRP